MKENIYWFREKSPGFSMEVDKDVNQYQVTAEIKDGCRQEGMTDYRERISFNLKAADENDAVYQALELMRRQVGDRYPAVRKAIVKEQENLKVSRAKSFPVRAFWKWAVTMDEWMGLCFSETETGIEACITEQSFPAFRKQLGENKELTGIKVSGGYVRIPLSQFIPEREEMKGATAEEIWAGKPAYVNRLESE